MAITVIQQRKKQQYLVVLFAVLILIALAIVWKNFLTKPEPGPAKSLITFKPKKIDINFEILQSPQVKELHLFEEISPYEGTIGRENPFLPYEVTKTETKTETETSEE